METEKTHCGPADTPYWEGLAQGRLLMQHCDNCGRWRWPAVFRCGDCGAWAPPWREIAPEGAVYSWTRTWHPFAGASVATPFTTVLAALPGAGGRRLMGVLEGDESLLMVDAAVTGRIDTVGLGDRGLPLLRWALK